MDSEENATSREENENDVIHKKIKRATTKKKKERVGSLKVNIKKTHGKSEHMSYRPYKVRVKGKKGLKNPTFHD